MTLRRNAFYGDFMVTDGCLMVTFEMPINHPFGDYR